MMALSLPFYIIYMSFKSAFLPYQRNALRHASDQRSGIPKAGLSPDLSLFKFKEYCHANKCTFNDIMLALFSVSLHEYLLQRGHTELDRGQLYLSMPFSLRELPETPAKLDMKNDFATMPTHLPLKADLKEALQEV
jgi:hypothetical protein